MAGFQPGPIQGEAQRRALVPEEAHARRVEASSDQAELDRQELQEVERAELYAEEPSAATPTTGAGMIARLRALFGRRSS